MIGAIKSILSIIFMLQVHWKPSIVDPSIVDNHLIYTIAIRLDQLKGVKRKFVLRGYIALLI